MLFDTFANYIEDIERTPLGQREIVSKLASLFSQAVPEEIGKLVDLCQGIVPSAAYVRMNKGEPTIRLQPPSSGVDVSIGGIYDELVGIRRAEPGYKEQRVAALAGHLDCPSVNWIRSFVKGRSKAGIDEITLLDALAQACGGQRDVREALERATNTIACLGFVAGSLWEKGPECLEKVKPQVGLPVRPESQTRRKPTELRSIWNEFGACFVHTKHDGVRCQIHKQGNDVNLFVGRDVQDWTDRFPDLVLAVQLQVEAGSVILESECVAFEPATRRVLPRKLFHRVPHHRLIVYDLLGFEGEDWRSRPYAERHALMIRLLRPDSEPRLVEDSQDMLVTSLDQFEAVFAECRANEEEGLIVIKPTSLYRSGQRSRDRVKIKAVDPVDAVIVGYYLDEKATVPAAKTFLLAVYDERRNLYATIGKAISGLTDQQRHDVYQRCKGLEVTFSPRVEARFAPDRWVRPELVVEVEVDYVFQSKDYTCGLAYKGTGYAGQHIRFVSGQIREDKGPEQATTVNEFLQMRGEPGAAEDGPLDTNSDALQPSLF